MYFETSLSCGAVHGNQFSMAKDVWSATNEKQQPFFSRLSSVAEREPGDSSFRYARALLDEPLKEMLVFHGLDLHEMSRGFPAKRDHTRPRRHQPWELQPVQARGTLQFADVHRPRDISIANSDLLLSSRVLHLARTEKAMDGSFDGSSKGARRRSRGGATCGASMSSKTVEQFQTTAAGSRAADWKTTQCFQPPEPRTS